MVHSIKTPTIKTPFRCPIMLSTFSRGEFRIGFGGGGFVEVSFQEQSVRLHAFSCTRRHAEWSHKSSTRRIFLFCGSRSSSTRHSLGPPATLSSRSGVFIGRVPASGNTKIRFSYLMLRNPNNSDPEHSRHNRTKEKWTAS